MCDANGSEATESWQDCRVNVVGFLFLALYNSKKKLYLSFKLQVLEYVPNFITNRIVSDHPVYSMLLT
jgi:hypothetical protein